ncbi:MAG TPA: hypothetical protein VI365_03975, partial [Trebonia sp.]
PASVTGAGTPPPAGVQRTYNAPAAALAAPGPNQRQAVADVDAILAKFVPPPGSHELPGAPAGNWTQGAEPYGTAPNDSVTDTSWWRVPGQPKAIANWETANAPRGFTATGPSFLGSTEYDSWSDDFWLPPVPGVLTERDLMVEAITNRLGQVYVRVRARITWIADRVAGELVPATTRSVTISALLGSPVPAKAGSPVTVTDPGEVASIVTLINRLPVYPGPPCIPVPTSGIRLVFRGASGPLLGAVVVPVMSCTAQLSLAGEIQPSLADNPGLVPDVLRIAGIHWFGY